MWISSLGIPPATASASVHAAEVFTTGISGLSHWRFGNVDWAFVRKLALPGMLGGAVISRFQLGVAYSVYWNNVVAGLVVEDLWMGFIKPVVLGFTLVSIGCHVGLRAKGGTQGVGRATTNAVVSASVAVLAIDFLLTKVLITLMY